MESIWISWQLKAIFLSLSLSDFLAHDCESSEPFIEGELSLLSYDAGSIFILKLFFQYYREAKQTGSRRQNS